MKQAVLFKLRDWCGEKTQKKASLRSKLGNVNDRKKAYAPLKETELNT